MNNTETDLKVIVKAKELTEEQVKRICEIYNKGRTRLADVPAGKLVKIGEHEFIVLEQSGDTTALIRKNLLSASEKFGKNNNYDGSNVDAVCNQVAEEIASIVGEKNIVMHTVDLTTDDGLKDYGKIRRRASLLTADRYRRYVEILDKFKPKNWWWLATALSTKKHDGEAFVECVSPSGFIIYGRYFFSGGYGVRPFCTLKSDIFVSFEE